MGGAIAEIHRDTDPLIAGTHAGGTGTTLTDNGQLFNMLAYAGLAIRNTTDSTSGNITTVTDDHNLVTDVTFHNGDEYEVYCTTTYNSKISTIYTDRLAGHKVTERSQLIDGRLPEDNDLDRRDDHVFGPGQPWQTRGY